MNATVLADGAAQGPVCLLDAPLSFWGGFDPATGEVIDRHHPQSGLRLGGTILLMAESRGSATAPGALAEGIRLGTAPAAIVMTVPDVNLAIGAIVAAELYGRSCPVLTVAREEFDALKAERHLTIMPGGVIALR